MRLIVPAGTYFLGDPCYAVPDDYWNEVLNSSDHFSSPEADIEVEGKKFTVYAFSTAHGDGSYDGSDGFTYSVDAGLIGLVPVELMEHLKEDEKPADWLGTYVTFDDETEISADDGKLTFGNIVIDTDLSDDWAGYDDDEDDEYGFDEGDYGVDFGDDDD